MYCMQAAKYQGAKRCRGEEAAETEELYVLCWNISSTV